MNVFKWTWVLLCIYFPATAWAGDEAPAHGWIVLSDGLDAWRDPSPDWSFVGDVRLDPDNPRRLVGDPGEGVLRNGPDGRTADLVTREQWGDVHVRLEFMISERSNSGVKLQGVYEVQLYDSWKVEKPTASHCGGIYPRAELRPQYRLIDEGFPPRTNAARAPGQWQTLEILFRAPRFDAEGTKTENARFERVVLNDQVIHEDVEVASPTGHAWRNKETPLGPLLLQGDHGPVAFRRIQLKALGE
ncbi:MAG: DUF1080 domain-containing protein [Pirellulaceae bacterium]|nr:DUF1080 domain-containing protein [Pirellulaceae bacterium]